MKLRNGFISNSSSSSFIMQIKTEDKGSIELKRIDAYKQWKKFYDYVYMEEDKFLNLSPDEIDEIKEEIESYDLDFKKYADGYIDNEHSFIILDIENYAKEDIIKILQILDVKHSFF